MKNDAKRENEKQCRGKNILKRHHIQHLRNVLEKWGLFFNFKNTFLLSKVPQKATFSQKMSKKTTDLFLEIQSQVGKKNSHISRICTCSIVIGRGPDWLPDIQDDRSGPRPIGCSCYTLGIHIETSVGIPTENLECHEVGRDPDRLPLQPRSGSRPIMLNLKKSVGTPTDDYLTFSKLNFLVRFEKLGK